MSLSESYEFCENRWKNRDSLDTKLFEAEQDDIIYIHLNDMPDTLKKSKTYKILSEKHKNNPKVPIVKEIYERELILSNIINISYVVNKLSSLYPTHIPNDIPDANYDFIIQNKDVIIPNLKHLTNQYPSIKYIQEITLLLTSPREKLLNKIIKYECIHLLHYCINKNIISINYTDLCEISVKYNNVNMLEYTHAIGGLLGLNVCNASIYHGSVDCLDYIYEKYQEFGYRLQWTTEMCNTAAKNGNLKCLKYIYEKTGNKCPWNEITGAYAAEKGHLDMIQYMFEKRCRIDTIACSYAAKANQFKVLKYLHKNGIQLYIDTCLQAAIHNNMKMLIYAHKTGCELMPVGIPDKICYYASLNNNMEMLNYAMNAGCKYDGIIIQK